MIHNITIYVVAIVLLAISIFSENEIFFWIAIGVIFSGFVGYFYGKSMKTYYENINKSEIP